MRSCTRRRSTSTLAPGGSDYYSQVLSVDSNDADAEVATFADRDRRVRLSAGTRSDGTVVVPEDLRRP